MLSDSDRHALDTQARLAAGECIQAAATRAETARRNLGRQRLRSCGSFECEVGRLAQWNDGRLWPVGVEVVGPTFDNLPWIEFGSKEWGRAHIALCEAAVRDAWLPAARQVTADNVAAQLESMTSGTEVGAVVLRVFVQFMATVPPEGDAPDAVTATARALADVRRMLGGSCSEIGRTFVLAADHLYPKPLPVRPAPVRQRRWKGMTEVEKKALAVSLASGCATRTAVWDAVAKVCGVKARTAARWFEREEAKASGSAFGRALGEALRLGARQMSES